MRLAIITTHPIQYYAPVFKLLNEHENIDVKVFYTWGETAKEKFDPGFGKQVKWDVPLLDGYPYEWVENTSPDPGSHHFKGIINPGIINQIKSYQPNAILVYGWAYNSHFKVMRYFKGKVPVYFRGDSTLLDEQTGFKSFLRWLRLRWVYSYIDGAFYVGTNNKAYFKKYGLKEGQLTFAPHAVDNEKFAQGAAVNVLELRQSLGIGAGETIILFAGKFEPKKSPRLLLDAFLNLKVVGVHLLFVGNGILENTLKTMATGNKNVHFVDFQNQSAMPGIYQACNLFCLPSAGPGETWGLAVNEAMAAGKPVLASDKVGCAIDLVIPGLTGDIFESQNLHDLSNKLEKLINHKTELGLLGINAKNKIQDWSFRNQGDAIVKKIDKNHANQ
jgi:glycosyltransferase involved in cell wall biosynthesis